MNFPSRYTPTSGAERSEVKIRTDNPMQPASLASAPRCGARTRSGSKCCSPAVRGRQRCRMHGGTNRGAPRANRNAWVHGNRSAEAVEQLKLVKAADRVLGSRKVARSRQSELLADFNRLVSQLVEDELLFRREDGSKS